MALPIFRDRPTTMKPTGFRENGAAHILPRASTPPATLLPTLGEGGGGAGEGNYTRTHVYTCAGYSVQDTHARIHAYADQCNVCDYGGLDALKIIKWSALTVHKAEYLMMVGYPHPHPCKLGAATNESTLSK